MLHSSHFIHYCGHAAEPAEATTPEQCVAIWPEHSLRHLELCAAACLTTDLMVEEPYLCSVDSLLIGQNIPEAVAGHDHHGVLRQQLHSPDIWRAFDMSAAPWELQIGFKACCPLTEIMLLQQLYRSSFRVSFWAAPRP